MTYFLFWKVGGGGEGLRDLIQIKGPHVLVFFFAYPLHITPPALLIEEVAAHLSLVDFEGFWSKKD